MLGSTYLFWKLFWFRYYIRINAVMSNITELKIKIIEMLKRREILLFFIFFFIASLSFGLGYLYAKDQGVAPIVIEKNC